MAVIRLTKEFSFEAAHALDGYDGPCREIHGHSYRLFVTVKGTPAEDASNPKCGMVLDFGVLKRIVSEEIVSRFDHALVLRASESGEEFFRVLAERFGNVVTVGYQPTCENMLGDFVVSYRNSTSNHNVKDICAKQKAVVSYRNSTSNHNWKPRRTRHDTLYLIEILHQTTTSGLILIDKVLLTGCLPL